jgi:hypothetical protein
MGVVQWKRPAHGASPLASGSGATGMDLLRTYP